VTMVYRLAVPLPALLLIVGCASSSPETAATGRPEPTDAAATLASAEAIDISELDTGLVCERSVPTGSRISEHTCYTREQYAARQAMLQEIAQRDVNEMRELQRNRELVEQEARRQAVTGGF